MLSSKQIKFLLDVIQERGHCSKLYDNSFDFCTKEFCPIHSKFCDYQDVFSRAKDKLKSISQEELLEILL